MNGYVLYEGASAIDGAPIVVIAVGLARRSKNAKTGGMVQTYILRADVAPTAAIKAGADVSICGNCLLRGDGTGAGRRCYVNVGQGPTAVWKAYRRGAYKPLADAEYPAIFGGRVVRFGTYGDPAAVPQRLVWAPLAAACESWTGYTHQWRHRPDLRAYCMASVDAVADADAAWRTSWRTFRVNMGTEPGLYGREAQCPASAEAGKLLTCERCKACSGAASGRRASIVINAHGGFAVMANVRRAAS